MTTTMVWLAAKPSCSRGQPLAMYPPGGKGWGRTSEWASAVVATDLQRGEGEGGIRRTMIRARRPRRLYHRYRLSVLCM